jgi:hypothetical protein
MISVKDIAGLSTLTTSKTGSGLARKAAADAISSTLRIVLCQDNN